MISIDFSSNIQALIRLSFSLVKKNEKLIKLLLRSHSSNNSVVGSSAAMIYAAPSRSAIRVGGYTAHEQSCSVSQNNSEDVSLHHKYMAPRFQSMQEKPGNY